MEDGIVESVTSNTTVTIRFTANNATSCRYLHLSPVLVSKGDKVKKGETVIGKVSNIMGGRPNTSIHLHFDCKTTHPDLGIKVHIPIYTSLVAAYRRAWNLPDSVKLDVLLNDPEREIPRGGAVCPPRAAPLDETKDMAFASRWEHDCSEVGLVVDAEGMKFVYIRPKLELAAAARRKPILLKTIKKGEAVQWIATRFNEACQDPEFEVTSTFKPEDTSGQFIGSRNVLNERCEIQSTTTETLAFARLLEPTAPDAVADATTLPPEPAPADAGLTCPFKREPVQVIGDKEIPPKSERSCNFLAVTVPGGISFEQMPRYIREWPGVRKELLIDKFSDQIITLRTAEGGVGLWWYWVTKRARHGSGLAEMGFGDSGAPSLALLARAMAGKDRSEQYVKQTYLEPYVRFASSFFGRTVTASEPINLADPESRWNLARTMFRLESGNPPVVSRNQFDCGIQFGSELATDYAMAGVETGSLLGIEFKTFKGLEHYTNTCAGQATTAEVSTGGVAPPGGSAGTTAPPATETATTGLADLQLKLSNLEAEVSALKQQRQTLEQQLSLVSKQAAEAGGKLSELGKQLEELGRPK